MDATIGAMDSLVAYEIGEVTAAATYYMAETYFDFSRSLAESERPTDLEPADLQDYERAIEEEAFPFEEKAIGLHEKNLEMLHAGVFNAWTQKSLARLAAMVPGRYSKQETSDGFLDAIDSYVYRNPVSQRPDVTPDGAVTTPGDDQLPQTRPAPATGNDGAGGHENQP
jgi:hypothetical protein